jgi:hypothetical protein
MYSVHTQLNAKPSESGAMLSKKFEVDAVQCNMFGPGLLAKLVVLIPLIHMHNP